MVNNRHRPIVGIVGTFVASLNLYFRVTEKTF